MLAREHLPTGRLKGVNARESYTREHQKLNNARQQVALAREHQLTARGKGVNAHEDVLASVKFKSSGTVAIQL